MTFFKWFLGTTQFMSHGHCYMWNPALVRLHVGSDLLIGVAYVAISLTLWRLVCRAKTSIPFHWMFIAFGTFIIACGATHFLEILTIWTPVYWLTGSVKALTATASVVTAITLPPLVPRTIGMVTDAQLSEQRKLELEAANVSLRIEIQERERAEGEVRLLNEELEHRVAERTRELAEANEALGEKAAIVQHSNDAIFSRTTEGFITSWNPAAERLYGYTVSEIGGRRANILFPPELSNRLDHATERLHKGDRPEAFEGLALRKDGGKSDISITLSPIIDAGGNRIGASVISRDITERRKADQRLLESQKLESLGVIAGGVAHDFNNLLVSIVGNASLALDSPALSEDDRFLLRSVVEAGEKASHLTRQLLAYAGKGRFVIRRVDMTALISEISSLIETSFPPAVQLCLNLGSDLPAVEADPGQLQQVVINLTKNGAEAVPESRTGIVLVTTAVQEIREDSTFRDLDGNNLAAGSYVSLEVRDTGAGMPKEVRGRIFDPFFTTKFTGRGLGLAAVHGIVRAHKGALRVESAPGKGSTFKVLLPAVARSKTYPPAERFSDRDNL